MTQQSTAQPGQFNPILGLADLKLPDRVVAMNKGGAAKAAVSEPTRGGETAALQISPLIKASRRFYRSTLRTAALCMTTSRVKEDIEAMMAKADERIVKDEDGNPVTFVVAFGIEMGGYKGNKELIRGRFLSGAPDKFVHGRDVVVPIKVLNVKWVMDEDADELRSTMGAMQGYLLKPRKANGPWVFVAWGLNPEREISIMNELFTQMGRASQTIEIIENDIHAPGLRVTEMTAARMDPVTPQNGGGFIIADEDGKIVKLDRRSQKVALGKKFLAWYVELESLIICLYAGQVGSIDTTMRPTVLELAYGMDFEAALGLAKEYMDEAVIEETVDRLEDTAIDSDHPTYAYLLRIGMFTEEDDLDFRIGQVVDAIKQASKMARDEIEATFREASAAFEIMMIPSLSEILDGAKIEDFESASAGEDPLTRLTAAALQEAFDWDRPLHRHLRTVLLNKAVREDAQKQEEARVELPKVMVNHTVTGGIRAKYDAVAMLSLHEFTGKAVDARVYDLTHGGDLDQIVAAYATLGVVFDLQDRKSFERLLSVIAFLGDKIKAAIG